MMAELEFFFAAVLAAMPECWDSDRGMMAELNSRAITRRRRRKQRNNEKWEKGKATINRQVRETREGKSNNQTSISWKRTEHGKQVEQLTGSKTYDRMTFGGGTE